MPAIKLSVVGIIAGLAASFAFPSDSSAVSLVVGRETLTVQTPTLVPSGIVYQTSLLTAYTSGFLFCDNISEGAEQLTFTPVHEDQTFVPAHKWTFNQGSDLETVAFRGGSVVVNSPNGDEPVSTLACRSTGPSGEIRALTDGIFDNGAESATYSNYSDMFNWIPPQGFDWNNPDLSQLPSDPCNPTASSPARVDEDVACTAVSAFRPSQAAGPQRSATVWTATDGVTFTYLFRIDNRIGPAQPGVPPQFQIPPAGSLDTADGTLTASGVSIVDAYDSAYLDASANYCFLTELPSVLNSTVCSGQNPVQINGPLHRVVFAQPPPVGPESITFYVAVNRLVGGGSHSNLTTPVVGVAVVMDPVVVAEGGNHFSGDDVLFGFMPESAGFPWMGQ